MSDHNFGSPWSVTKYNPRYFVADTGESGERNMILWDVANTQNVIDELEHLVASLKGELFSLQVGSIASGASKIELIKKIRQDTGVGLRDAKDISEGATHPAIQNLSQERTVALENTWALAGARMRVFDSMRRQVRGDAPSYGYEWDDLDPADLPF